MATLREQTSKRVQDVASQPEVAQETKQIKTLAHNTRTHGVLTVTMIAGLATASFRLIRAIARSAATARRKRDSQSRQSSS